MPELPDIALYLEALQARLQNRRLERIRLANPFLLRSVEPPIQEAAGKTVTGLRRLGKRIVFALEDDLFLILHLMIAGRLHWKPPGAKPPAKLGLAAFDFADGTLILTEAGSKRRASLHLVSGPAQLMEHDRGGLEVFEATLEEFRQGISLFVTTRGHVGFPFVLDSATLPLVERQLASDQRSIQSLAKQLRARVFRAPRSWSRNLLNANTPAEWKRVREAWKLLHEVPMRKVGLGVSPRRKSRTGARGPRALPRALVKA